MSNSTIYPYGQNGQAQVSSYASPLIEVSTSGDVTQALDPNTFYKFTSALTSLALTLNSGNGTLIYTGKFTTATDWGGSGFSVPAGITPATNSDSVAASHTYEFNIIDNILRIEEVA